MSALPPKPTINTMANRSGFPTGSGVVFDHHTMSKENREKRKRKERVRSVDEIAHQEA